MQLVVQIRKMAQEFGLDGSCALQYARNLPDPKVFVPKSHLPFVGWYAIPSEGAMAMKLYRRVSDPREQHCLALRHVHAHLEPKFYSWYDTARVTPICLNRCPRTESFMARIAQQQPGDILIVAAQLGEAHTGESVANTLYAHNECGIDAVAFGSILMNRPCRCLTPCFGMDCAGDDFMPDGMAGSPFYRYRGGRIEFGAGSAHQSCHDRTSGVATMYVPE
jgi:hypothetical protein